VTDRGVAERIAAAVAAPWRDRNLHLDGHLVAERDGVVVSLSGLPAASFSAAAIEREPADPVGALRWADEVFSERGLPLGVVIERGRHPSVEGTLEAMNMTVISTEPAMAVGVDRVALASPIPGLEVRRATTADDLDAMATLEVDAFGTDAATARGFFSPGILERRDVALYVARAAGTPVSMAYVQEHDDALGVFSVATAPFARRRGYGAAMTAASIAASTRAGADLAWLQASGMGQPVYERLGFEVISIWDVWIRPRASTTVGDPA
jgi:ribosomal protein S18 acetylase RimI-like enzyme